MDYFRFSEEEYARRFRGVAAILAAGRLEGLIAYGTRDSRGAVAYLTNWLPTREAFFIFAPGEMSRLLIQLSNHVLTASRMSIVDDVQFAGSSPVGGVDSIPRLVESVEEAGLASSRIGIAGALAHGDMARLHAALPMAELENITSPIQRMQMIKSDEEIALTARAAALSDAAVRAITTEIGPGANEHDVAALIDSVHVKGGGNTTVRYMLTTAMDDPDAAVPLQYPRNRRLARGDVIVVELSAALSGYTGQVLRSFSVGRGPTRDFARMHVVAEAAFKSVASVLRPGVKVREVMDAASCIEEAGYSIWDDLLHGANQFPPIVRTRQQDRGVDLEFEFVKGMVVVVQPNVVSADWRAGVQYGEMLQITSDGASSLHDAPQGFLRCK